jgi:hypothetical protein
MTDPVQHLNDLLAGLSLEIRGKQVLDEIINLCHLQHNTTRKKAKKRVKQKKIHLCLDCFVFYDSKIDLRSHVHEAKHATGPKITKSYKQANEAYKVDSANVENQTRRLFALTKDSCLQKIGKRNRR